MTSRIGAHMPMAAWLGMKAISSVPIPMTKKVVIQRGLAAMYLADPAHHDRADRARDEADAEGREGEQQRSGRIVGGKKFMPI